MNDLQSNATPSQPPAKAGGRRKFFSGLAIGGLVGSLLATGITAWSQAQPGRGCGWHGRHTALTPEQRSARAEFATDWVLSRVEASAEQRARIRTIVQNALNDLSRLREQHVQNREAFMSALTQPTVDRDALNQIRRAELQLAETGSDRLVDAIADAADVLTPQQRAKLVELAQQFRRP